MVEKTKIALATGPFEKFSNERDGKYFSEASSNVTGEVLGAILT